MNAIRILALVEEGSAPTLGEAARALEHAEVETVSSAASLLARLRATNWTATIVSLRADHVDETVITRIAAEPSTGSLILCTRGASLSAALLGERVGAVAVLDEPLDPEEVGNQLRQIVEERAIVWLPSPDDDRPISHGLVGNSRPMADVFHMIARVAASSSTVLITGESGTGKEVVARTLHEQGERRSGPFIAVNCAAIPEHLLESELFGHEKGAFTGAVGRRVGRFERANGGTLFLDEIGDMSVSLQAKVLRAIEERVIEPVGAESTRAVDVRLISATHQDLAQAISEGRFREDLYYRLSVVDIGLPPLRERGEDIRNLALHFAVHFADRHGREIRAISERALSALESAHWPGNVRELRNVMDRGVLLTTGDTIRTGALRLGSAAPHAASVSEHVGPTGYPDDTSLAEVETDHIRRVLRSVGGQIGKAAAVLGIHRNTLARKIQDYGMGPRTPEGGAP
jgi:DNA-binding NtrC family response regulator